LKAIFGYDPLDASGGDGVSVLVQFLGDDFRGHLRVEESIPYDLAYDLIGPAVVCLGTPFAAFQSFGALALEEFTYLVIALAGIAILPCGFLRAKPFTLALVEHGKFQSDFIIFPDGKRALRAAKGWYAVMHFDHGLSPPLCNETTKSAGILIGRG
jgi:hypothetical protein